MSENRSYENKFIYFILFGFGTVLLVSMLIVFSLAKSSYEKERQDKIQSSLEVLTNEAKFTFRSITRVLEDQTKLSVVINSLMQFDKDNLLLRDTLSELRILGFEGKFAIISFDGEYLFGSLDYDRESFKDIMSGNKEHSIRLVDENKRLFNFYVPINYSGSAEGVFIFQTEVPEEKLFSNITSNYNLTIVDGDKEVVKLNFDPLTTETESLSKKIDYHLKLVMNYETSTFVRDRLLRVLSYYLILFIAVLIFSYLFYRKGYQDFVAPHEKLLEVRGELTKAVGFQNSLLNSSPILIISTDQNGLVTSFNKAAEKNLGYRQEDIVGKESPAIWHKIEEVVKRSEELSEEYGTNIEPGFDSFVYPVIQGRDYDDREWTFIRKDGSEFVGRLIASATYDDMGEITGFLGVIEDVTLHKIARDLEAQSKKELEQAAKMKSEFLANMSHEIRTPMNGVLGMAGLLGETNLDENQRGLLDTILKSGNNLLSILNDILDLTKIESGKLVLEDITFDAEVLIKDVIKLNKFKATEKGIKLVYRKEGLGDAVFVGDENRIKQIVQNYLSNALKFTQEGFVEVVLGVVPLNPGVTDIEIKVVDSGIGISKEASKKLFQSFSQADASTSRKFGGSGLGLSICSKLARLMGGDVFFESNLGEGSLFGLSLTLENGNPANIESTESVETNTRILSEDFPHRILVAEDNQVNQKLITLILKSLGYSIDIAENGLEAYEKTKEAIDNNTPYTIILMDIQMPELDGIESTKKIINQFGSNSPLIVATTANAFKEDKDLCFEAGMVDFVAKPYKKAELIRVLKKCNYNSVIS